MKIKWSHYQKKKIYMKKLKWEKWSPQSCLFYEEAITNIYMFTNVSFKCKISSKNFYVSLACFACYQQVSLEWMSELEDEKLTHWNGHYSWGVFKKKKNLFNFLLQYSPCQGSHLSLVMQSDVIGPSLHIS